MLKQAFVDGVCKVFAQIENKFGDKIERVVRCENGVFDRDPNNQFVRINKIDYSVADMRDTCKVQLFW